MTSFSEAYFEKRKAIESKLMAEGHIPLGKFMSDHDLDISDLCFIGLIDKKPAPAGMSPYIASATGHEYFIEPMIGFIFVNVDKSQKLASLLKESPAIRKLVEERKASDERRKAREEERKRAAKIREIEKRERERERELIQVDNEDCRKVNQIEKQELPRKAPEKEARDPNITLMIAVPSMLFFLAILIRFITTTKPIGISDWLLLTAFGFFPAKYIFTFGVENITSHVKTIFSWLVMLVIFMAIVSKCSDENGSYDSNCYYRVGC